MDIKTFSASREVPTELVIPTAKLKGFRKPDARSPEGNLVPATYELQECMDYIQVDFKQYVDMYTASVALAISPDLQAAREQVAAIEQAIREADSAANTVTIS